jgi:hypothetical protein
MITVGVSAGVWVPNWSSRSGDLGVFVDQSAEPIAASDAQRGRRRRRWKRWQRRGVVQRPVRTVGVEVRHVPRQHSLKLAPVQDRSDAVDKQGTTTRSGLRTPRGPPRTVAACSLGGATRRPRGEARGFPRSWIVCCGPAVPAGPGSAEGSDTAVVPPRPTIMSHGHWPAVPQVTAVEDQFGTPSSRVPQVRAVD